MKLFQKYPHTNLHNIKYEIRSLLGLYPKLFFPLLEFKPTSKKLAVGKQTDIVIEGFPRSGNSFAVGALRAAQPYPVNIATHLHAPANVISGVRKGIPTLVVIRKPVDAIVSLKALNIEVTSLGLSSVIDWNMKQLLRNYIRFYRSIMPYKDKYVLGLFEEVTKDFSAVIDKINKRFNTNFSNFNHTEENVKQVFEQQGVHCGPTDKRNELKALLRKEVETERLKPLVYKAESIYQEFKLFVQ